jgi:hypothetical protein
VPFLTLDAQQIGHSGTVLIVCADPRVVAGANFPEPSRVHHLVARVRNDPAPGVLYGMSPHVIAVTCPPRIIGEDVQRRRFVNMNAPVLAGASRIIIEAHNGCAGLFHFYGEALTRLAKEGKRMPYFELQRSLLERGLEHFAKRVAALGGRGLVVEANYVDFGTSGSVAEVTSIRTVQINDPRTGLGTGITDGQPPGYAWS